MLPQGNHIDESVHLKFLVTVPLKVAKNNSSVSLQFEHKNIDIAREVKMVKKIVLS